MVSAAARRYPGWLLGGGLPGIVLILAALVQGRGFLLWWGVMAGLALLIGGVAVGLIAGILSSATQDVPANMFGLCSGMGEGAKNPPLTIWLSRELDLLAGKDEGATAPLTFGNLWQGPPGWVPHDEWDEKCVKLEMITTNLTHGRPYRLPFETRVWFFDPSELRRLFPEHVVRWMEDHPPDLPKEPVEKRRWELLCKLLAPLRPLPPAADLPVVVATRMSLSFPFLISAVPLWAVDWSRSHNQGARRTWYAWLEGLGQEWDRIRNDAAAWKGTAKPDQQLVPGRCWFSDGGIASNFPVHFFDAPLPRWPTFAINLRPFHPDSPPQVDETRNVWAPSDNSGGITEWWTLIEGQPGAKALGQFLGALVDTVRNWADNSQLRVPGYRDRIAHVQLAPVEGGMNLRMPAERILALSKRGQGAGHLLAERFGPAPPSNTILTWDNHRWIRYRTIMVLLDSVLAGFVRGYRSPVPPRSLTYSELIRRGEKTPPTSYPWARQAQRTLAEQVTQDLVALREQRGSSSETFEEDAPHPLPELRVRPRL
jgi:hypothetical protein